MLYALLFIVWVGFGFLLVRKGHLFLRTSRMTTANKKIAGSLLLLLSGAILIGGLLALADSASRTKQPASQGITLIGWIAILVLGLLFVFCQTMAVAMLLSSAEGRVTRDDGKTSTLSESAENAGRLDDR